MGLYRAGHDLVMNKQQSKMWSTCMMEYYTDTQENVLICTTRWTNCEDIILSEMSQIQKDKYSTTAYMRFPELSNSQQQREEWWLPGAGGGEGQGAVPAGPGVAVRQDEEF